MEATSTFSLVRHEGEYESWPLETELLEGGQPTGMKIPGFVLEAQYRCGDQHLFVTSWDCPFEESLTVILTNAALQVKDKKSIGAMYTSVWLERHEVVEPNQLLLHCDNGFQYKVTVAKRLKLERKEAAVSSFSAYPQEEESAKKPVGSRWKFW
jgi:hypothetical protein